MQNTFSYMDPDPHCIIKTTKKKAEKEVKVRQREEK